MQQLTINTESSQYKAYQTLETNYRDAMYKCAPDPQLHCRRPTFVWQQMDYAKNRLGLAIAELIKQFGVGIIDAKTSDPKFFKQILQQVSWLKQPQDPVCIGTQYIDKRSLLWGLGDFLTQHLVNTIPLPLDRAK
ncbi:MAG: hypothetical protein K1000chlam2_01085 [Chlamydiae bacterium]|nr:hypothetical protein [Chlamydiota bacterium]